MAGQSKPTLSPWGSAVAGSTGAVLANAMVYPLDLYVSSLVKHPRRRIVRELMWYAG